MLFLKLTISSLTARKTRAILTNPGGGAVGKPRGLP